MALFSISKTLFKSILREPATRRYPFGKARAAFKNTRGRIETNISECIFCGICAARCPAKAITVHKEEKAWAIDRLRCVACGCCTEACPKKCLRMENEYAAPVYQKKIDTYHA
jgi:formate hydrogenlyase subunit 6/NADH:ubiquinone oxidoreductase subunit I